LFHHSEIRKLKPYGLAGFQIYREAEHDGFGDASAGGANRLFSPRLSLRCCIAFPILSGAKQSMNFAVRFVADSVDLRIKLLPRRNESRLLSHGISDLAL